MASIPTAPGEELLKALMLGGLNGDAAAHAALLRALVPLLRSFYGRRLGRARDDIEDLVQETLIAVHTRRAAYDRKRPFTAWLYAVARYRMIDYLRRRKISVALEDLEDTLVEEDFEQACLARMDVETLLATLSPKQARAIRNTHVEGKSAAEAAAEAGIGESDVKVSVHRGMKALVARIRGSRA
ncbi:MAG TPA: sigma-70 family RNA polymerase sigma factor [Steroidobacteraceae bacterium]|nr:sigma-70 family RNA polymerase sigma factor [Steroidobacteraceae bacterium]